MHSNDLSTLPATLGPYRLLRRLGFGGTSQVFEAAFYGASGFEKRVAIKTLLPQFVGDHEFERLFIREATLGAHLTHPNLVQVHDFGIDQGTQYMRLDLVCGGTLADLLLHGPLSPHETSRIAAEIGRGLAYLHDATDLDGRPLGLVHRDLKPSNVLLGEDRFARLGDFGISKATAMADVTRGNVRRGSYCYMSPEQVRGERLGPRSDQFSFGSILYEMLTGVRAFDAPTVPEVCDAVEAAETPSLDAVPPPFRPVVQRLLSSEPSARYPGMADAVDALPPR